ncbi:MAG: hypothetical protein J7L42_06540 [Elusimicrobia bacterium]|nr:hypothetical protein [Elusimicrobiota bacterium]
MKKSLIFIFLFWSILYAEFYELGREIFPFNYYSSQFKGKWNYSNGWQDTELITMQYKEKKNYSFFSICFGNEKYIGENIKAGFKTGILLPADVFTKKWNIPFFSTTTTPSTDYNWNVSPSTYSAFYNSVEAKLFLIPVMGFFRFFPAKKLQLKVSLGIFLAHLEEMSKEGEIFERDTAQYKKGAINQYTYWKNETDIIPVIRISLSAETKFTSRTNFVLEGFLGWCGETEFLMSEYTENNFSMKTGYSVKGLNFGLTTAIRVLF